jgi:hypothetical protein
MRVVLHFEKEHTNKMLVEYIVSHSLDLIIQECSLISIVIFLMKGKEKFFVNCFKKIKNKIEAKKAVQRPLV